MPAPDRAGNPRVGVVERRGRFTVVEPFFERGRRITLGGRRRDVSPGDLVLVRFARSGKAEVVRRIGRPDVPRDVIEALLADRGYDRGFPSRVEGEARDAAQSPDGAATRRDLTGLPTFTIDPVSAKDYDWYRAQYAEWGLWVILIKGLTPIPYKLVTIASGAAHFDLFTFVWASIVTRGVRFFVVAALLWKFGEPIRAFIEKRLTLLTWLFLIALIGGFVAFRYIF